MEERGLETCVTPDLLLWKSQGFASAMSRGVWGGSGKLYHGASLLHIDVDVHMAPLLYIMA